ncbi:MAG: sporulation protein YqfC [Bacillota bacterium]
MSKNEIVKDTSKKVGESMADILDLPKEVLMDVAKITIVGSRQVTIENHKGIIQYTSEKMRISVGEGEVIICGKDMVIKSIAPEEINISGTVQRVLLEK